MSHCGVLLRREENPRKSAPPIAGAVFDNERRRRGARGEGRGGVRARGAAAKVGGSVAMCAIACLCRHRDELIFRRRQIVIQFDLHALRLILGRLNLLDQAPLVDRDAHVRAEHLHFAVAHIQPVTDLDKVALICSDEAGREEKQRRSERRAGGSDVQLGRSALDLHSPALSSVATRLHARMAHHTSVHIR